MTFSAEVQRTEELGTCSPRRWSGGGDTRGDGTGGESVFATGGEGGLATSCISCCSCMVKVVSAMLMLFSETFCLFVSSWRWCYRYPKMSATPWGVSRGNDI